MRSCRILTGLLALALLGAVLGVALAPRSGPAQANPLTGAISVAAGTAHTCVVTTESGVKCWGSGSSTQLGNGTSSNSAVPVSVCASGSGAGCSGGTALTGVAAVSAGISHTCAVTVSGGAKCWGDRGDAGVLGDGFCCSPSYNPVDVVGLTSGAAAVAAALGHTCALTMAGTVKCWGWNGQGELGLGTADFDPHPVPVDVPGLSDVTAIAAGGRNTCALMTGGGVKCWGSGGVVSPEDVPGLTSGVASISAGGGHACAVMEQTGGLKCWGANGFGQVGNGTISDPSEAAVDVLNLSSNVLAVGLGWQHSCAVSSSGLWCWGGNDKGQLGDGTTTTRTTPVSVPALAGSSLIALAGGGANSGHTCAVLDTGGVACWGNNDFGQLGIGFSDFPPHPTPAPVVSVVKPTPTPKAPSGDTDGDTLTNDVDDDDDNDGCLDTQEVGLNPLQGGLRNPHSFWDFMDQFTGAPPARDLTVAVSDIGAVVARFGASGDPSGNPLAIPLDMTGYHTSADRGGVIPGLYRWDLLPPDGVIAVGDIGAVVAQFGHSCA